jgi:hypothetical protein
MRKMFHVKQWLSADEERFRDASRRLSGTPNRLFGRMFAANESTRAPDAAERLGWTFSGVAHRRGA